MDETQGKIKLTTILFDDDGRLARKPYWLLGVLLPSAVLLIVWLLVAAVGSMDLHNQPVVGGIVYLVNAVVLVVAYCVWGWIFIVTTMKRLHDRGMSGWWFWIVLVPGVGWLILLIICAVAGDEGSNAYGPPLPDQ